MQFQWIARIAFTLHVVVGNFCMMSMTHAQEAQVPRMAREAMQMPADCERCFPKERDAHAAASRQSPCDDGHCLFPSVSPAAVGNVAFHAPAITAPAPPVARIKPVRLARSRPRSRAPPGPSLSTKTIVLLL